MSTPVGDAHINVNANTASADRAMRDFSRDAQGRLRDVRGGFISTSAAGRQMGVGVNTGASRAVAGLNAVAQSAQSLTGAAAGATAQMGSQSGGLGGAMAAVAGLAGASLLPALGAVVPMMVGAGLAAGTLAVAFNGVGDAVALAGKDQEKYREALKKMGPEQRAFTTSLVDLKKQFGPIGREIQKATLPGFTRAVKSAGPVVKILGDSMTEMGAGFGKAAEGVGRLMKDSGFQSDLQANLRLGNEFVQEMTSSLGPFTRSLLDFGAASGPTLKSFSDGLGGLLSKGLPDMFTGLQAGIPGTSKMLDGLFSMINDTLGAIGRFAGEAGRTLGPLFGETFKVGGSAVAGALDVMRGAMILARPVIKDIGFGLKTVREVGALVGPTIRDTAMAIVGAFGPVGDEVNNAVGPLQRLNQWVNANKIGIQEAARVVGVGMIDLTSAVIQATPTVISAFRQMAEMALNATGAMISGLAKAFGNVPIIGDKLKDASRDFNDFKDGFVGGLNTAEAKARDFAAEALPRLAAGELRLNINNWSQQLATAKAQLKTVPPEKRAALLAKIDDLTAKVARAKGQLASVKGKTVNVGANTNQFTNAVGGLVGRTLGTSYINVAYRQSESNLQPRFGATGGLFTGKDFKHRGYARGGLVDGPGTETSDDVYAPWLSKNEFVVNAKQTKKHLPLLKAINSGGIGLAAGGMAGAGADAGTGLASGLTSSTGAVLAAAKMMAAAVEAGIRQELEIASPSKKTKALAKDVGAGFIKGLTGSRDKIKAVAKDLSNDIKTAFSGKRESSLLKMVARETDDLLKQAAKRDAISKKIADANKFATDTAGQARSTGSLATIVQDDAYSPKYVEQQMKASLAQIKSFTSNVSKLQKKGVNKDLLRQILEMGPEQGAAFAKSLAGADAATIKRYNSLNTQISSASSKLGKTGADMLYDSGKKAGAGFLTGLKAQQKDIEKLMLSIAKGMQSAIKKALGIKSPSRVMDLVGRMTVRGLHDGILRSAPTVQTAMQRVSAAVEKGAPGRIRAAIAPTASKPQLAVGDRRSQRTAPASATHHHHHYYLVNQGAIGSSMELQNWFTKMLDTAGRTNRVPASVKQSVLSSLRSA